MKKSIIAIALVAITGMAGAQVTLSGKVSQFIDRSEVGATTNTNSLTEPTSNVAFSVKENLGAGMSARAVVETSLNGNTFGGSDTRLGDRQATVGIANKWVGVDLGRNVHSHFLAITSNDAFGTLYGSVAGDIHNLRNLRIGDAVFVTANLAKNIGVAVERTQAAVGPEVSVYAGSAEFGGIQTNVARWESGNEKSTVVGARTKMGSTALSYSYSDDQGLHNSVGHLVGASQNFGNMTAKASWGKTDRDVKAWAVGADYHFSKRTDLTVAYRNVDRTGTASDVSAWGVGLTHRF
jgi:predicted porin